MTVEESDLPGVGKKHVVELDGEELVIITHNTGRREVFKRPDAETDSEKLFELSDALARTVGTILEGAYFQPVEAEKRQTTLPGGILLEWYEVQPGSPLAGETIAGAHIGRKTGVNVVAIERSGQTVDSPGPDTELQEGDTLVVTGTNEECDAFEQLLAGEE
ncbi:cation:proton antiporter regulatory subunit [Halapricum hydrolyticum]|uniref:Potassium transporter TrkA n=1 Tax=Halapricum hydrolyticum TaxID=2979991 RepID=A0AAE3IBH2_9EURY|nr:TrkA C-terminal domain-containing protein [Halapricum hydrolyticum]MCU4717837.1 potassium transporter TrkA [Halapricum hydrolyticum]MCU4727001.1 potassium transporter TrkA [Halapricum hydrolyticum]